MTPVIRVEELGKSYRLGLTHAGSVRELVNRTAARAFGRHRHPALPVGPRNSTGRVGSDGLFWALRDVSFDVASGEVFGVIGKNGAGKSTLLKILSRITPPTSGRAQLHGRLASLLEVGTGFHPELTGRENLFLNGTLLGMTRHEVARKLDEIVAFAEVDQFLDTPVKRYSSGMYVRLAFAVAAHLDPEILIVDEVLAVGDVAFQEKCLGKMDAIGHEGRTVLFVSHNLAAVRRLTQRSILLSGGRCQYIGPTDQAIDLYCDRHSERSASAYDRETVPRAYPGLLYELEIQKLSLLNHPNSTLSADAALEVELVLRSRTEIDGFCIGVTVFRQDQTPVGSTFSRRLSAPPPGVSASFRLTFGELGLAEGRYHCGFSLLLEHQSGNLEACDCVLDALHFEVLPASADNGRALRWNYSWGPVRLKSPRVEQLA